MPCASIDKKNISGEVAEFMLRAEGTRLLIYQTTQRHVQIDRGLSSYRSVNSLQGLIVSYTKSSIKFDIIVSNGKLQKIGKIYINMNYFHIKLIFFTMV
jgi:hypothetical protein